MRVVLDSSALLAVMRGEPGAENVPIATGDAVISTVNYAEVISVLTQQGMPSDSLRKQLSGFVIEIVEFGLESAVSAGLMIGMTKRFGLSLGDRACLAEAARLGAPALTADRAWKGVDIGVPIQFIR